MKATDLRIGNLIYYRVVDRLDERKEWFEVSKIAAYDLTILQESLDYDYQPIPITEEWLLRFGFVKGKFDNYVIVLDNEFSKISYWSNAKKIELSNTSGTTWGAVNCMYLHQLQNLYFALRGEELTIK
jgi:hypothetical protein